MPIAASTENIPMIIFVFLDVLIVKSSSVFLEDAFLLTCSSLLFIVLSLFFVALYYTAVSIKLNFMSNSLFMIFLGILLLLPFTIFFYIHASRDSQILNEGFDRVLYLGRLFLNKLKFKFKKK